VKSLARVVRGAMEEISAEPITRERVHELEREIAKHPQISVEIRNWFSDGVYGREMRLPAGSLITGKIHKYQQLNILSAGEVSVLIDGHMQRVKAPFTVVAPAGAKRIIYAHADAVWTVMHGTEETDLEKIEAHFIAQDEEEYQRFLLEKKGVPCLGS